MTILKLDSFSGMIPRLPADRLPDGAAAEAINCNFAHGELRSLRAPATKKASGVLRALFTDNGVRFYGWPVPTRAFLSPTIDDTNNRMYFANASDGFRVALTAGMTTSNPAPPSQSWLVGVARPAVPPTITKVATTSWNGQDDVTVRITALLKTGGATTREIETTIITVNSPFRDYIVDLAENPDLGGGPAPLVPGSGGFITLPEAAVFYFNTSVEVPGPGELVTNPPASAVVPAGWKMRISGLGVAQFDVPSPTADWVAAITGIQYQGRIWTNFAEMFDFYTGTGSVTPPSSSPLPPGADTGLDVVEAFRFEVLDADGIVLYSTENTFGGVPVVAGPGVVPETYRQVVVEYSQAGADTTAAAYVTTFENTFGEESAPSDPVTVDLLPFEAALITQVSNQIAGGRGLLGMNVYRVYGSTADFIKVNDAPDDAVLAAGSWSYTDTSYRPRTSVTLQTTEWEPPPQTLRFLTYAGNGYFAGAVGKDLRFSEPYRPHAWPYFMTLPHTVTGIIAVEGGLLVTTAKQPYLIYGAHPEQMNQNPLNADQAGLNDRAMARVEGMATYISNDGIVTVSGGQASVQASQQLFTRNDWRDLFGTRFSNLVTGAWDGMLLGAVDPSLPVARTPEAFMLRLDEAPGYSKLQLADTILGFAVSDTTDELFVLYSNGYAEFGRGANLPLTWRSRVFEYPRPVFFAAGIVDCTGSFTLRFYAQGTLIHTQVVIGDAHFRLPAVRPEKEWQVEITGTGTLRSLELGASFAELQDA